MHKIPQNKLCLCEKKYLFINKTRSTTIKYDIRKSENFLLNKTKVNKFEEQVIFFSQIIWEI